MQQKPRQKIICLAGPTGAGKSALAIRLCNELGGAVVNSDSRQVYRDFPIITAQPGPEESAQCPHLLYGFLPCGDKISAGRYADMAAKSLSGLALDNTLPVVTGGTGLYFRALLYGIADIPPVAPGIHRHWQERCQSEGSRSLHALLLEVDPEYAAKIHPNDPQRVTRALEVWEATGRAFSWWHRQQYIDNRYDALFLGMDMPLDELEPRLALRIEQMLAAGAVEEARKALEACPDADSPGWSGIGCAELMGYLKGEYDLDKCRELWLRNTRAYAKRQLTWFRAQKELIRISPGDDDKVLKMAEDWLGT